MQINKFLQNLYIKFKNLSINNPTILIKTVGIIVIVLLIIFPKIVLGALSLICCIVILYNFLNKN